MNQDLILFIILAAIAIITAISMLISRNAVYSAMFLVLNFVTVAVLYLLLNAAFIAMVQVTVYAGAIMVLFLFVIMLLGAEKAAKSESLSWQPPLAVLLGGALLMEFAYILFVRQTNLISDFENVSGSFGSPASIGDLLFDQYLAPFEITSFLLLVAMVGAIVITRREITQRENKESR
jgi:NADH-quinone oxidoreductase subunit J